MLMNMIYTLTGAGVSGCKKKKMNEIKYVTDKLRHRFDSNSRKRVLYRQILEPIVVRTPIRIVSFFQFFFHDARDYDVQSRRVVTAS